MERRTFLQSMMAACAAAPRMLAQSDANWGGPVLIRTCTCEATRTRATRTCKAAALRTPSC